MDTCPLFQDQARLDLLALNLGDIRGNGLERTGVDNADLVGADSIALSILNLLEYSSRHVQYHTVNPKLII